MTRLPSRRVTLARLVRGALRHAQGARQWFVLAVLASVGKGLVQAMFPLVGKAFADELVRGATTRNLVLIGVASSAVALATSLCNFAGAYAGAALTTHLTLRAREEVAPWLLEPVREAKDTDTGRDLTLYLNDSSAMSTFLAGTLPSTVFQVVRAASAVVTIAFLYWPLLAVVPISVGLALGTPLFMASRLRRAQREASDAASAVAGVAAELLADTTSLKALGAQSWAEGRLRRTAEASAQTNLAAARLAFVSEVKYVAMWTLYGAVYVISGLLVVRGEISVGTAIALNGLTAVVSFPGQYLADMFQGWNATMASVERLDEAQRLRPPPQKQEGSSTPGPLALSVDGVAFAYGTDPVLQGVHLDVPPGQRLGIAGVSGAGKSTLARLVTRLDVPSVGGIRLGEVALEDWDDEALRRQVAYVPSSPRLFRTTLRENLLLGRDISDIELEQALAAAHCQDLGLTLESDIAEAATNLSTGQRQRLGIARALAGKPGLLILDEATGGLDTELERAGFENLGDTTVVVIAHRWATLQRCESIALLDAGRVVEMRTPDEVVASEGMLASLLHDQLVTSAIVDPAVVG